jgi:hypothetical protein
MRKINLCLIMIIIFAYPVFSANDTDYFRWNNPVEWLDNQRKPISGEKIFRNFTDLAHHIRTDSETILLIIQSDSEAKNYRMNLLESDSVIKNVRIYDLENFKNTINDTYLSKYNISPYTPIEDYNPVTKKYVIDLLTDWISSDSSSNKIDTMLVLYVVNADSIVKNNRIIILENFKNTINDTYYTEFEIKTFLNQIGNDTELLSNKIILLESDSEVKNNRIYILENFKNNINDTFYFKSEINNKLNDISGDSITNGIISYLKIEDKFLRNDIEDTGVKLNITGDLYVSDTFIVDGKIILGKIDGFGNKPDLELNANLKTDLIPFGNNYNLGSGAQRWRNAYVDTMIVTTLGADSVEISGTLLPNFTINSGNDTFENSSITFYQADTEKAHGNILYRYPTDDFLINKTVSINGDVLSNGIFSGNGDSLTINSIFIKNYIDSGSAFLETNKADSVHTHLISDITDSIPYSKLAETPFIPDTSPYALQSTVDAIVTDTAEWSKITNKPDLGIDTAAADLRYANINRGVVYLDDWQQILDFNITTTENIFNVLNGCTFTLFSNSNETSYFNAKLDLKNCGLPTDTPNYLICQIIISYNNSELKADTLNYEQNFTAIGLLKKNEITPSIFNCVKKQYSQNYYYSLNAGINTDKTLYINAQFNNIYWCSRRIKLWIVGYGY